MYIYIRLRNGKAFLPCNVRLISKKDLEKQGQEDSQKKKGSVQRGKHSGKEGKPASEGKVSKKSPFTEEELEKFKLIKYGENWGVPRKEGEIRRRVRQGEPNWDEITEIKDPS